MPATKKNRMAHISNGNGAIPSVDWPISRLERNRIQHTLNGNMGMPKGTGKGKGKGKAKAKAKGTPATQFVGKGPEERDPVRNRGKGMNGESAAGPSRGSEGDRQYLAGIQAGMNWGEDEYSRRQREEREAQYAAELQSALPRWVRDQQESTLKQEEWKEQVKHYMDLDHKGGVSLCPKWATPQVLEHVSQTTRPTAIVASQPPWEFKLAGYGYEEVYCTLVTPASEGNVRQEVCKKKYLIQISMRGGKVQMDAEDLIGTQEVNELVRVVLKFCSDGGWGHDALRPLVVVDVLEAFQVPKDKMADTLIRGDGAATARVHCDCLMQPLRHSGEMQVFVKVAADETRMIGQLEVAWLPGFAFEEAQEKCRELLKDDSFKDGLRGLVRKESSPPRFGIRVENNNYTRLLGKLSLNGDSALGRYTVAPSVAGIGEEGVVALLAGARWAVGGVLFVGDGHAIVLADKPPEANRFATTRMDASRVLIRIFAMNATARDQCKAASIEMRSADAEGELLSTGCKGKKTNASERLKKDQEMAKNRREKFAQTHQAVMDAQIDLMNPSTGAGNQAQQSTFFPVGQVQLNSAEEVCQQVSQNLSQGSLPRIPPGLKLFPQGSGAASSPPPPTPHPAKMRRGAVIAEATNPEARRILPRQVGDVLKLRRDHEESRPGKWQERSKRSRCLGR